MYLQLGGLVSWKSQHTIHWKKWKVSKLAHYKSIQLALIITQVCPTLWLLIQTVILEVKQNESPFSSTRPWMERVKRLNCLCSPAVSKGRGIWKNTMPFTEASQLQYNWWQIIPFLFLLSWTRTCKTSGRDTKEEGKRTGSRWQKQVVLLPYSTSELKVSESLLFPGSLGVTPTHHHHQGLGA